VSPHFFSPVPSRIGHAPFTDSFVSIRRDHILEDGYSFLNRLGKLTPRSLFVCLFVYVNLISFAALFFFNKIKGPALKNRVGIRFVSNLGMEEVGVDGGGLFKEFLTTLIRRAFDPNAGLFKLTSERLLYPNPQSGTIICKERPSPVLIVLADPLTDPNLWFLYFFSCPFAPRSQQP
jgi:hypothetical protein